MRDLPSGAATLISLCALRRSVILRGALPSSALPCALRRCVSSSCFASSLMRSLGPSVVMPAFSSCDSSLSTGTLRTSANCSTVTSDIFRYLRPASGLTRVLEQVRARSHDQLPGALGVESRHGFQLVERLVRQLVARADPAGRELVGELLVHAVDRQQVLGRPRLVDLFLARDRMRQQHVARAVPELLDHLLVELLDPEQLAGRHVGNFLDRREAFLHEHARDVLVHVELNLEHLAQDAGLLVAALRRLLFGHHVEAPAGQLAREPDVLAATADGLRQAVLGHGDVHRVRVLVHHDRSHLGRLHRIDDELRGVLHPGNDVDPLAGDLVRDRLHARAAHADAGTDRVDARVEALHRDLGARAGIARRAEDLDEPLAHLGHLELEQLDKEVGRGPRQEELRAARLGAHLAQQRLEAVLRPHHLARDHVLPRHESFGIAAEIHVHAVAVDALYDAGNERRDAVLVLVHDLGALGFAHLLHDDLLGRLGGDAAEGDRFHRHLDEAADLGLRVHVLRIVEAQFALGELELGRVVGEDLPATERAVFAGLPVDLDPHVDVVAVLAPRRGRERGLERLEDDLARDALLVGDGLDDFQDLLVHDQPTNRALLMPARGSFHTFPSTSIVTSPPSTVPSRPRNLRRPSIAAASSMRASLPANRAKCSAVRSGRSKPGEDTSSRYSLPIRSSASRTAPIERRARSQSSSPIPPPSVRSMECRASEWRAAELHSTSSSSYPSAATTGSSRPNNLSFIRPPPVPETKNGLEAYFRRPDRQQKSPARGPSDRPFGSRGPRPGLAARTAVAFAKPPAGADDTAGRRSRSTRATQAD